MGPVPGHSGLPVDMWAELRSVDMVLCSMCVTQPLSQALWRAQFRTIACATPASSYQGTRTTCPACGDL